MNKLTKIGASALCGSLAAISAANAGDLTVTGGADLTYTSLSGQVTGNPIGVGSNFGFAGSGELDNGWNVALSIAHANAGAYSNAAVTITVPGLGAIRVDQGVSATGIQRLDDMTPSVWEEADGAGQSAGITKVAGVSAGGNIELSGIEAAPAGLGLRIAYAADADSGSTTGDKAAGGASGVKGSGYDITVEATSDLHGVDGLTVYGGFSQVDQYQNADAINGDSEETVLGVKYAMGNFSFGYQQSDDQTGVAAATSYDNTSYSVTFNVNDDLSVGYNHIESDKDGTSVNAEAESLQVAYTMGGASIRIAEVKTDNISYSAGNNQDATIISLGLAF
jgi:outer membrane protein OmpU